MTPIPMLNSVQGHYSAPTRPVSLVSMTASDFNGRFGEKRVWYRTGAAGPAEGKPEVESPS